MCGLRSWLNSPIGSWNFTRLVFMEITQRGFSGYNYGFGVGQ